MKKLLCVLLATALMPISTAFAVTVQGGDWLLLDKPYDDAYLVARELDIQHAIDGDVMSLAQMVTQSEAVAGDVSFIAQQVRLLAPVADDVRVVAQTIEGSAQIGGHALMLGQWIHLKETAAIGSDIFIVGERVILDGAVTGNARIIAQHLVLNGTIAGNTEIIVDTPIEFGEKAKIAQNAKIESPKPVDQKYVGGMLENKTREQGKTFTDAATSAVTNVLIGAIVAFIAWQVVSAIIVGVVMLFLARPFVYHVVASARTKYMRSLGIGISVFIVPLVLAILALFLLVTAPLGFLFGALYALLIILSGVMNAFVVGHLVIPVQANSGFWWRFLSYMVGMILLMLFGFVGPIGWIASFLLFILTLGSVSRVLLGYAKHGQSAGKAHV